MLRGPPVLDDPVRHSGHGTPVGDPFLLDETQHLGGVERPLVHDHGVAVQEPGHGQVVQAGDVEQRQGEEVAPGLGLGGPVERAAERDGQAVVLHDRRQVAVRVHRALHPARRPARVEDDRGVVLLGVDLRHGLFGVAVGEPRDVLLHGQDRREGPLGALEGLDAAGVGDDERGFGVVERVLGLAPRPPGVAGDRDGSVGDHGPEGQEPLGGVRRVDGDAVAFAHPVLLAEHAGQGRRLLRVFPEGEPPVRGGQVGPVPEPGRLGEDPAQVPPAVPEALHAAAEHLLFALFELAAGAGQPGHDLVDVWSWSRYCAHPFPFRRSRAKRIRVRVSSPTVC